MTLDEAIVHARAVANEQGCTACGIEHGQLADWLEELRERRKSEEDRNANCSRSLLVCVYENLKGKPPVCTKDCETCDWYQKEGEF